MLNDRKVSINSLLSGNPTIEAKVLIRTASASDVFVWLCNNFSLKSSLINSVTFLQINISINERICSDIPC